MSRFNVRPIGVAAPPPPPPTIVGKQPSAYAAMKNGTGHDVISHVPAAAPEPAKKKGRPSKDEIRRHKLAMADDSVQLLVEDKPTRNKIRDYIEHRILELDMEKR
jgi:hypothetical protein